jgi:hypothetical protein
MGFAYDLFVPFRPRWIGLMTAEAGADTTLVDFDVGVIGMPLPWAMAPFTRQGLVFVFG